MIIPTITLVFDRKHTATPRHPASVEVRIIHNRKPRYLATGIKLLPKHWRNGTVVNRLDAQEINRTLDTIVTNVRKVVNDMLDESQLNTAEIKSRLQRLQGDSRSFLEFCEQRAEVRAYGKREDTRERYDRFMRWLKRWGRIVYFSDVTEQNIMAMDEQLALTMKPYSKWNNYHRFLNSFILDAIDEGLLRRNPYRWLHIDKQKRSGLHKFLTPEELDRIETAHMPTDSLERVRDLFLFQTYTCLSYTDLADFDADRLTTVDGTDDFYRGRRGKTGQEFRFILLPKARAILDKYHNRLPLISNVKYNAYLKAVAQAAAVDRPVTSHWARHTGATLLLNAGVPMETVANILGHASTKQTRETYARLLDRTVAQDMKKGASK